MPDQVTFRGGTGCSTIDYFCLNNAAQQGFRGVQVQSCRHKKAHWPVQLKIADNGYAIQHC
eukprot:8116033-Pyramimonas_sp.AAC.1